MKNISNVKYENRAEF